MVVRFPLLAVLPVAFIADSASAPSYEDYVATWTGERRARFVTYRFDRRILAGGFWPAVASYSSLVLLPAAPALIAPENEADGVTLPVMLAWVPVPNAVSYRVPVAASESFEATLAHKRLAAGRHEVDFEANPLPNGVYLYRLDADGQTLIRSMILSK